MNFTYKTKKRQTSGPSPRLIYFPLSNPALIMSTHADPKFHHLLIPSAFERCEPLKLLFHSLSAATPHSSANR